MTKTKGIKRFHWLARQINRNNFKVGAEIGCEAGITTSHLLRYCSQLHLYAVDTWGDLVPEELRSKAYNYHLKNFSMIYPRFIKHTKPYHNRLTILRGISWEMAGHVKDESLDFIFIDADHGYETVMKDILAWGPKVRPGGLISGHDYDPNHQDTYGVVQAVDEYFGKDGFSLTFDFVWFAYKKVA
jgi:hypothetical protein